MEVLDNQKQATITSKLGLDDLSEPTKQTPAVNGVAVSKLFAKIIRGHQQKTIPRTMQRPIYLRYIEYL